MLAMTCGGSKIGLPEVASDMALITWTRTDPEASVALAVEVIDISMLMDGVAETTLATATTATATEFLEKSILTDF